MTINHKDIDTLRALVDGIGEEADAYERKWGVNRLSRLVGDELREKFYRQLGMWRRALEGCYAADVVTGDLLDHARLQARRTHAAWRAIDKAATEAGEQPLAPNVWEVAMADGTVLAFCRTVEDAHAVVMSGRQVSVWTPAEIANVIAAAPALISQAKAWFPGATVQPARRRAMEEDEEIPF